MSLLLLFPFPISALCHNTSNRYVCPPKRQCKRVNHLRTHAHLWRQYFALSPTFSGSDNVNPLWVLCLFRPLCLPAFLCVAATAAAAAAAATKTTTALSVQLICVSTVCVCVAAPSPPKPALYVSVCAHSPKCKALASQGYCLLTTHVLILAPIYEFHNWVRFGLSSWPLFVAQYKRPLTLLFDRCVTSP